MKRSKNDLEDRLISFSLNVETLTQKFDTNFYGTVIHKQLIRSSSSAALHYGEVQGAESAKDFIHKVGVILKELRESMVALKIVYKKPLVEDLCFVEKLLKECNELISIFVQCIKTAQSKQKARIK